VSDSHPFACISIVRGTGSPREVQLFRGTELEPFSIGRRGTWSVSQGPSTADIEGFFYFDGEQLFAQSAAGAASIEIGSMPVGHDWVVVDRACDIKLAAILLRFAFTDSAASDERTSIFTPSQQPPPRPLKPATQASRPAPTSRSHASDSDATQLLSRDDAGVVIRSAAGGLTPRTHTSVAPTALGGRRTGPPPLALADMRPEHDRLSEGMLTTARPLTVPSGAPMAPSVPARPAFGGFSAPDDEVTAYGPLGANVHYGAHGNVPHASIPGSPGLPGPHGVAVVGIAANSDGLRALSPGFSPSPASFVASGPGNVAMPGGASVEPAVVSPPKLTGLAWWKAEWQRTSIPKRVMLCLSPALLLLVPNLFTSNGNSDTSRVHTLPSASTPVSAAAALTAAPLLNSDPIAPGTSTATPTAAGNGAVSATSHPAVSATSTVKSGIPGSQVPKGAVARTLERQAADAVADDRHAEAARLYQQLAQQHPERPAFAQAALILSAKAAAKP
jgi:hypothetical protein